MAGTIRVIEPDDQTRLAEIGALTALAYLSDALVDVAHPYVPALRDAHARAAKAILLAMADGEGGEGAIVGTLTVVPPEASSSSALTKASSSCGCSPCLPWSAAAASARSSRWRAFGSR